MKRQQSSAEERDVRVEVDAYARIGDLPEWLNTRKILDAAIAEYHRQRIEAASRED